VTITAAMAASLEILTAALDDPDTDIARSLRLLALDAEAAIPTYLGLSVVVPQSDPPLTLTSLADGAAVGDIGTSLRFSLAGGTDPPNTSEVVIMLYAGAPGTFVDLAADLAWLTGRPPADFTLDQHLTPAPAPLPDGTLPAAADVNQAVGVLLGRGYTPQQADRELDTRAANHRIDRHTAARHILATITTTDDDGHDDRR
jgi:hypothetical protein